MYGDFIVDNSVSVTMQYFCAVSPASFLSEHGFYVLCRSQYRHSTDIMEPNMTDMSICVCVRVNESFILKVLNAHIVHYKLLLPFVTPLHYTLNFPYEGFYFEKFCLLQLTHNVGNGAS